MALSYFRRAASGGNFGQVFRVPQFASKARNPYQSQYLMHSSHSG
jgi:hypothetical protein